MISVTNIGKDYGGQALFSNVSFHINNRDKIGLAGKNGAGKTTLLRIISKEINPDKGDLAVPDDISIGYLPQEKEISSNRTILQEVLQVFSKTEELVKRNEEISFFNPGTVL